MAFHGLRDEPHDAVSVDDSEAESVDPMADKTPRSEAPPATGQVVSSFNPLAHVGVMPDASYFFAPQPVRVLPSIPATNVRVAAQLTPTATSVHGIEAFSTSHVPIPRSHLLEHLASDSTVAARVTSVESWKSTPLTRPWEVTTDPSHTTVASSTQQPLASRSPPLYRAKSSHAAHHSLTSGMPGEHFPFDVESADAGSRTAGNSPARSPNLFHTGTSPLRLNHASEDSSFNTSWLPPNVHRQPPKETHKADIEINPNSGRKVINHYEICKELGRGMHGKVKLGRDLNNDVMVAIKIIDRYSKRRRLGKNTSHEDKIKREIAILKKARHPHIVSLLEVIDDPSKRKVYIILEHVALGEVKWRAEGVREICLVEWRRYQRESEGVFDNEDAAAEDEKIIQLAHRKLERQERRLRAGPRGNQSVPELSDQRESADESSDNDLEKPIARAHIPIHRQNGIALSTNMETAFRSTTPTTLSRSGEPLSAAELEGTMYGAYHGEPRNQTPSVTGSASSQPSDFEEIPEHFLYVPVMTLEGTRATIRDTVLGLEYLHYQNVIHRDIKPANLLVTKAKRIKISDFGVSYLSRRKVEDINGEQSESEFHKSSEAVELAKMVGTPAFYAPELCHAEIDLETARIGNQVDIWALGVTLYCLIYGRVPFHDHNQWSLMKRIAEDDPYISRYRLKPVVGGLASSSFSDRLRRASMANTRAAHDLEYEEIDDDLRDLFQRIFVKDPRRRITIKEIKRHPWLTRDIENLNSWVDETDPGRSAQGQKIHVSKDDIDQAVIPFSIVDHIRLGLRKVMQEGSRLIRQGSRKRADSSASSQDPRNMRSANSSSSTISQDGRCPSLGPGSSIAEALSKLREPEHALSHSLAASPLAAERGPMYARPTSRTASPAHSMESRDAGGASECSNRPRLPERAYSAMSSAASIRTIRPSHASKEGSSSPAFPPALPGTPTALESPGGSNLGGIFGGMPKRAVHNARSDEKMLKLSGVHGRTRSIDQLSGSVDSHGYAEPSLAISPALAAGHVDQPDLLKELPSALVTGLSPNSPALLSPERTASRQSSVSSLSLRLQQAWSAYEPYHASSAETPPSLPPSAHDMSNNTHGGGVRHDLFRQRQRESPVVQERLLSKAYRPAPPAIFSHSRPTTVKDDVTLQRQKVEDFLDEQQSVNVTSVYPENPSMPPRTLTSSSSEDQFTCISQSTSNPSIPSVISATSSVAPDDCSIMESFPKMVSATSGDSIFFNQFDAPSDDPAGYDGDHAVESEDDDSGDDEFLVMGRKSRAPIASHVTVIDGRSNLRDISTTRRRSARSGSNGTVKKVFAPDEGNP